MLSILAKSGEGRCQRVQKTPEDVKIFNPDRARKTIRSNSVWKVAESLKARGTFRNFQSMVDVEINRVRIEILN